MRSASCVNREPANASQHFVAGTPNISLTATIAHLALVTFLPILAAMQCRILTTLGVAIALAAPPAAAVQAKWPTPLSNAHAHNDYYHKRPLLDALDRGFTSIEADVFLVGGELLVGHYDYELRPERTLKALYLDPLEKRAAANNGRIFDGDQRLTLLVDFKTDGPAAYAALAKLLAEYDGLFSEMKDGKFVPRAVDVIVTGNRPVELIERDPHRRVAVDGRKEDLDGNVPKELVPLVSENWSNHFKWRGQGEMPAAEREHLEALVKKAHQQGRRLRFWGAPDDESVWAEQLDAGVELVGADDLDALQRFLTERAAK
jgi:hypothetical protein